MAKHEIPRAPRRRARGRKRGLLLAAVAAVAAAVVGGTLAFLLLRTDPVTNTFEPGIVSCAVEETFNGVKKENVKVQNTGNVPVYIRVKLLPYWYDQTEDKVVAKSAWVPSFTPEAGWILGADGFYYYTQPVAAGDYTAVLIPSLTLEQDGVTLARQVLEILASCVQAEPDTAVEEAWGKPNGSVTDVDNGNALVVTTPAPTTAGGTE